MFDPLLEEDPWVKEKVAEGEARGEARGIAEERLRSVRGSVLTTVSMRFPSLTEFAETKVRQTEQWDALNALFVQLLAAADEQVAREILEQFSAS